MQLSLLSAKLKKDNPPGDQDDVCSLTSPEKRTVIPLGDILRSRPENPIGISVKLVDPYWNSRVRSRVVDAQGRSMNLGAIVQDPPEADEEFEEDSTEVELRQDIVHSLGLLIRCRDLLKELDRICERCDLQLPADTDVELGTLIDDVGRFVGEFSDVEWLAMQRELAKPGEKKES
jgi:hypothetical protein